jgi:hypothetical protein
VDTDAPRSADDAASSPGPETEHTNEDDAAPGAGQGPFDLRGVVRQLTAPMIESLDARLRDQIEAHVDELLDQKVDSAIANRLQTIDRAIADLSRSVDELGRRLGALERADEPVDDAG